jgi:hypothetical protein
MPPCFRPPPAPAETERCPTVPSAPLPEPREGRLASSERTPASSGAGKAGRASRAPRLPCAVLDGLSRRRNSRGGAWCPLSGLVGRCETGAENASGDGCGDAASCRRGAALEGRGALAGDARPSVGRTTVGGIVPGAARRGEGRRERGEREPSTLSSLFLPHSSGSERAVTVSPAPCAAERATKSSQPVKFRKRAPLPIFPFAGPLLSWRATPEGRFGGRCVPRRLVQARTPGGG